MTEDKAVEQKVDDGAEKSASAVNAHYRGVSCNCLPYRYCPYVHGSGKSGKYRKEAGDSLKAETDGSGGAQNVLTKEEIAAAEAIIVAADKNVEMARLTESR